MRATWIRRGLVTVAVGTFAVVGLTFAGRIEGASAPKLTGADIAEIQQLWSRYSQGWDFRDVDLYLSTYTDDAVFTTGAGEPYAGKDAIKKYLTTAFDAHVNGDATHNNMTILVEPTPEGARGRGGWFVLNVLAQPPAVTGTGHYEDTYVRTPNGWRIKTRKSFRGWPKR
jgi:hypothetical protein